MLRMQNYCFGVIYISFIRRALKLTVVINEGSQSFLSTMV